LTHLEQVSVALLMTGQARWVGIVQGGDARVQRETGLNDAEVAARPGGAPSGGASASCLTTAAFAMLREGS
jgi:hypothetical protein